MDNIFTHLQDMPPSVSEFVTKNPDNTYSVFINAKLSREARMGAFRHAMRHISCNDFEKCDVQKIECEAHKIENQKGG